MIWYIQLNCPHAHIVLLITHMHKAGHKSIYGWSGSVPAGLHTLWTLTQIHYNYALQVSWICESSICKIPGTCHRSGLYKYQFHPILLPSYSHRRALHDRLQVRAIQSSSCGEK
jgi:hypothetical protein